MSTSIAGRCRADCLLTSERGIQTVQTQPQPRTCRDLETSKVWVSPLPLPLHAAAQSPISAELTIPENVKGRSRFRHGFALWV